MQAAQFNAREILTRFRGGAGAPLPPDDYQQNLDQSNFYQDPAVTKPRHQNNIQKKEKLDARIELEKEFAKVKKDMNNTKAENRTLKEENEQLKQQLNGQRKKSDDTIARLRNVVVTLRKQINTMGGYNPDAYSHNFDGTTINRVIPLSRSSALPLSSPAINRQDLYVSHENNYYGGAAPDQATVSPGQIGVRGGGNNLRTNQHAHVHYAQGHSPHKHEHPSGHAQPPAPPSQSQAPAAAPVKRESHFAGPTFSEIMRRSTPIYKDFKQSLRSPKDFYNQTPMVTTIASAAPVYENEDEDGESAVEPASTVPDRRSSAYWDISKRKSVTEVPDNQPKNNPANQNHAQMYSNEHIPQYRSQMEEYQPAGNHPHPHHHPYELEHEGYLGGEHDDGTTQHRPFQPFEYDHVSKMHQGQHGEEYHHGQHHLGHEMEHPHPETLMPRQPSEEVISDYEHPEDMPTIDLDLTAGPSGANHQNYRQQHQ